MTFDYVDISKNNHLLNAVFEMKVQASDIPYNSLVIPNGTCHIYYIFSSENHLIKFPDRNHSISGFTINGPIYGAYNVEIPVESEVLGLFLKPTSLYKLKGASLEKLYNEFQIPSSYCEKMHQTLEPIFVQNKGNFKKFQKDITHILNQIPLHEDIYVENVDRAVDIIDNKKGLIKIDELVEMLPLSRKTLQASFKRIVGITLGRYIRQIRFANLLQQYKKDEINFQEMMYCYNYYDASHFVKDFQFFTLQSPSEYFQKDYELIENYMK